MTCATCGRGNDRARRYCGGCGAGLPACTRCGFSNDRDDHYCGGCGTAIEGAAAALPTRRVTASRPAVGGFSQAELSELFEAAPPEAQPLPQGTIGQDDLDRLFGGDA